MIDDPATRGSTPRAALTLEAFAVPPRFDDATFESYQPDPEYPSQAAARARLCHAIQELNEQAGKRGLLDRFRRPKSAGPDWQGLYLDGRFGVGKTHLLAASYHAADTPKAYLSFQELTYAVGSLGMASTLDLFSAARLVCLDEFELDDPGNTMLATSFVRGILERGTRMIVTSNTLPGELGRGRFSADEFEREIGSLSSAFESIRIDGEDYRHRRFGAGRDLPRILPDAALRERWEPILWSTLLTQLSTTPPLHYPDLTAAFDTLAISGLEPITDQDTALRFVHFIDKVYDRAVPIVVSTKYAIGDLFPESYGYGGFERKFRRCQSRLHEMLAQPIEADRGVDIEEDEVRLSRCTMHGRRQRANS